MTLSRDKPQKFEKAESYFCFSHNVKNLMQLFHRDSVMPRLRILILLSPTSCCNKCLPKYVKSVSSFTDMQYIMEVLDEP